MLPNAKDTNRAGRQLIAGSVEVTVTSRKTNQHITMRLKCRKRDHKTGKWIRSNLADAFLIFVSRSHDQKPIARLSSNRDLYWQTADTALQWALGYALRYIEENPEISADAFLDTADRCGRCWMKLTDPESIARGIGPDCLGKATGSKHVPSASTPEPVAT